MTTVIWNDDDDVTKKLGEMEDRLDMMWERLKEIESVMSTAFRLHAEGFRPGKPEKSENG